MASWVVVVVREEEHQVRDDPSSHDQLDRQDRVDFLDEPAPDGLVTEVESRRSLLVLRNGDPSLLGLAFNHRLSEGNNAVRTVVTFPFQTEET